MRELRWVKDDAGNVLTLEESNEGIWQSGTYYECLKNVIETSLTDTQFPYDASANTGSMGGAPPGGLPSGEFPDGGSGGPPSGGFPDDGLGAPPSGGFPDDGLGAPPSGERPDGGPEELPEGERLPTQDERSTGDRDARQSDQENADDVSRLQVQSGIQLSGTYATAQDYIDALNADKEWVSYDAASNTATITSISDFAEALKPASKSLGAFDQLDGGHAENQLFGYGDDTRSHFDAILAGILSTLQNEYAASFAADMEKTDAVGNTVEQRVAMYTPLYYLLDTAEGYGTSSVAGFWRIRTGINQSDTPLTTEVNLSLALDAHPDVQEVDFATVWGEGHTEAERTGSSSENFIAWVDACMAQ